MTRMICWNEVKDFAAWKSVFDSHADAHTEAGLTLEGLWRDIDDPNEVIFIFQVSDRLPAPRRGPNPLTGPASRTAASGS